MSQGRDERGAYVRRVQEGSQSLTHDLLAEVDRLRLRVATLEVEKEELAARAAESHELGKANEALRALAASLEAEMNRLHEQVVSLRAAGERHESEQARLAAQLESARSESRGFEQRYAEIEAQSSNLANLYVASYSLHGTLDRQEVVATIQEIVANLIGSEEAGLFELAPGGEALELVASFGLEAPGLRRVPLGAGRIGEAARTGEIFVVGPEQVPAEDGLTACIPLKLDGRVTGAIAIFRLLPQKAGFEALDRELFELLATHAATALYCTSLHARRSLAGVAR